MKEDFSFKAIHSSIRPARVVVLLDERDPDWQDTCVRIIEFFSKLWGGAHNLIIPTDGKRIDERFWTILQAFDPDYLYLYGKAGEDLRLSRPEEYAKLLEAHINSYLSQSGSQDADFARAQIDEDLRRTWASDFSISQELQDELKIRLAPFYFEGWTVEPGAIGAGSGALFPLTSLATVIRNTQHSDRIADIKVWISTAPKLWYGAAAGLVDEQLIQELDAVGIRRDLFEFEETDLFQLVEFVVTGSITKPGALRENKRLFMELDGVTPYQLSMTELGLYRSPKYRYWEEPLVLIAGNTINDFCLYYSLSRLRERVVWVLPSITEGAFSTDQKPISRVEMNFISLVRNTQYSQKSRGGFALGSYSLSAAEIDAVVARLRTLPSVINNFEIGKAADVSELVRMPLTVAERDNFQRDIAVQFAGDMSIAPFPTPKPKNFQKIHPYDHRYITQLSVAKEAPPKHFRLGKLVVSDQRLTTKEARVGKDGPAYFCPTIAYFGGDIDTVLVKPQLRLPPLSRLISDLARIEGYECRPSDKGIYADQAIDKWGGLMTITMFFRDAKKRGLLESFLETSKSTPGKGVYLDTDRRRYLDFEAFSSNVGQDATKLIDELIAKRIIYRGFIFQCSYCRNSSWFSVGEVTEEFKCKRCARSQIYGKKHWRMPNEPAWFYKLDELVYQGLRQGTAASLLALDYLRSRTADNFSFVTDREFWKPDSLKPDGEIDFACVTDGVLNIGEAKTEDRLGNTLSEEQAEVFKYKRIASGLAARKVVFATLAQRWNANTVERAKAGFAAIRDVDIEFLTASELF